jgi:hypothetical protein
MSLAKLLPMLVPSLIGTLIGGLATLIGIWVKNRLDEKHDIQLWFEERYIFGAVEPLLTALRSTQLNLVIETPHPTNEPLIKLDRDAVSMVGRVGQLLRSDVFERLLTMAVSHLQRNETQIAQYLIGGIKREDIPAAVPGLVDVLHRLQEVLVEQEQSIERKTDVLRLADTEDIRDIVAGLERLDDLYERALSANDSSQPQPQ